MFNLASLQSLAFVFSPMKKHKALLEKLSAIIAKTKDRTTRSELESIVLIIGEIAMEEGKVVSGLKQWPKPLPSNAKYPWSKMEVGDAFRTETKSVTMMPIASKQGQKYGCVFSCRSLVKSNKHVGTIVTRVE